MFNTDLKIYTENGMDKKRRKQRLRVRHCFRIRPEPCNEAVKYVGAASRGFL